MSISFNMVMDAILAVEILSVLIKKKFKRRTQLSASLLIIGIGLYSFVIPMGGDVDPRSSG